MEYPYGIKSLKLGMRDSLILDEVLCQKIQSFIRTKIVTYIENLERLNASKPYLPILVRGHHQLNYTVIPFALDIFRRIGYETFYEHGVSYKYIFDNLNKIIQFCIKDFYQQQEMGDSEYVGEEITYTKDMHGINEEDFTLGVLRSTEDTVRFLLSPGESDVILSSERDGICSTCTFNIHCQQNQRDVEHINSAYLDAQLFPHRPTVIKTRLHNDKVIVFAFKSKLAYLRSDFNESYALYLQQKNSREA